MMKKKDRRVLIRARGAFFSRFESVGVFRFDRLIRPGMIIRDVKQRFPATLLVFEQFRFRPACDDCDIESVARKNGLDPWTVAAALNQAAFGQKADTDHAGQQTLQEEAPAQD
jgi:hypothetical protein